MCRASEVKQVTACKPHHAPAWCAWHAVHSTLVLVVCHQLN